MGKIPILAISFPGDEVHKMKCIPTPAHLQMSTVPSGDRDMSGTCSGPGALARITALIQQHSQAWTFELHGALRPFQRLENWIFGIAQHNVLLWQEWKSREYPASRKPQSLYWACRNPVPGSPFTRGKHHSNPNPITSQGTADNMPQLLIYYKLCIHIQNNIDCLWRLWNLHRDVMYQLMNWNLTAYFIG